MISSTGTRQASETGFTLIEVLIALVILSTGIILVLRAFGTEAAALGESRDSLWESLLAKEKFAEAVMAAEDNRSELAWSSGRVREGGADFQWNFQARRLESLPAEMSAQNEPVVLSETVTTMGRVGSARERSVTTYVITGRRRNEEGTE